MNVRALIFDIGGTVFDWQTAVQEALDQALSPEQSAGLDPEQFAYAVRDRFLTCNASVMHGERSWLTSDQMLTAVMQELCALHELSGLPPERFDLLAKSWQNMPAWSGAREGTAALRRKYLAVPLTILSWPMAVGSSRRNGIEWDGILSCDVLGIYKPYPRVYVRAAEIIDCSPEEIMMVAAHPSDLRAAIACGYRSACVLPRLHDPGEDYTDTGWAEEFDVVAQDFPDLARQLC